MIRKRVKNQNKKMNDRQFEKLVQNLQDVMRCPNCSSPYFLDDIHYLGQMDTMTFLHLRCHKCSTPVFASVAVADQEGGLMEPEIVDEQVIKRRKLSVAEPAGRIFKPVTHDDVLDIHDALFRSGDSLDLFLRPGR
jgi:hypothetical protein